MAPSAHILLLTLPAWGCLRPLCVVAAKAIQAKDDIIITYMTFGDFDKKIQTECDRYIPKSYQNVKTRLRFVNIGGQGSDFGILPVIFSNFPDYYSKLTRGKAIQCHSTGFTIPPVNVPPTCVITDYNYLPVLRAIRAITGKAVPVLNLHSGSAFFELRTFGPEKYGLPAYVHEIFKEGYQFIEECDGFVYTSGEAFEADAIHATREWLKESGNRPLYAIGPMLPPGVGQLPSAGEPLLGTDQSAGDSEVVQFMDRILVTRGENSLVYMSFGSLWWPMGGGYVQLFLEALLKFGVEPFGDGLGRHSLWTQHRSRVSCSRQTSARLPITFDEPANAAHLSLTLDVAWGGVQPAGTVDAVVPEVEDVLEKIRGEEAEIKRRNAEKLRDRFREGWEEGGAAWRDFMRLLEDAKVSRISSL
ncbi:hypothetical protein L218DRAFT_1007418 [Marasmius fiardii PR-910]|nr:hypothetical protein L218DRAFT_1007418 [Marasmius fiardii PR-910]